MTDIELFNKYKELNNIDSDYASYDYDNLTLGLILDGKINSEVTLYDDYVVNKEPLPIKGDLAVLCDEDGNAKAITRIKEVNIIEFGKVKNKEDLKEYAKENNITINSETLCVEEIFEIVFR